MKGISYWQGVLAVTLVAAALDVTAKQEDPSVDRWYGARPVAPPPSRAPMVPAGGPLLWDNGSVVTHPGAGSGGADASLIHGNFFGYNHNIPSTFSLADDFQIQAGSWQIDSILVYGYQPGSGTTPSINDLRMQIWDGPPNVPGSQVVWGNLSGNVLSSAVFSGIYRVNGLPGDTLRPLMALTVNVNTVLAAGQYWIEWQAGGSGSFSGPYSPPIQGGAAGNAMQRDGLSWTSPLANGIGNYEEFPFLIFGSILGGFDCGSLVAVVGTWDDTTGRCGNITSAITGVRYQSALLNNQQQPELISRGGPGYSYAVEFVQNRVLERTAATSLFVHASPYPLVGVAQTWNRMLAFNISGDGKYSIYRYNGTAKPVAVQKWTPIVGTAVAAPPATNRLEVRFDGMDLDFMLNGETLRIIPTAFSIDQFGLGFVRSRPTTGVLANDDWLEIQNAEVNSGGPRSAPPPVSAAQAAANARANLQPGDGDPLFAPRSGKDAR